MNAKQSKSTKQNSKSNIRVCGRLRTNVFVCLDGDHPDKPLLLIEKMSTLESLIQIATGQGEVMDKILSSIRKPPPPIATICGSIITGF
jgi:hypothetical protein